MSEFQMQQRLVRVAKSMALRVTFQDVTALAHPYAKYIHATVYFGDGRVFKSARLDTAYQQVLGAHTMYVYKEQHRMPIMGLN